MTLSTISTAYLNSALLPAVRQAQSQLATLEVESTTGQYADLGLHLGPQAGYELSLRNQTNLLQAYTTANGITSTKMATAQTALTSIATGAQNTAKSLMTWSPGANSNVTLAIYGKSSLQDLIGQGNVTVSGGYLFGGENTDNAPLSDFYAQPTSAAKTALNTAFQAYFGFSTTSSQVSSITPAQMQGFLSGPYAAEFQGSNWTTNWSSATNNGASTEIAPGHAVQTSATANSSGFQQLAQGYAMLSEFGNIGLGSAAMQTLVSSATNLITGGANDIIVTQATLGANQATISQVDDSMSAQMDLLQKELSRTVSVDPAQVATELTTLTTQLQAAYQLTAKLHSMNLAQYLPT
jgi:flagellar hook-associated protein 3 FlgL